MSVLEMRGLKVPLYSTMASYWIKLVRSEGGRSLCAEILHGKGHPLPTIFGVASQRAELIS